MSMPPEGAKIRRRDHDRARETTVTRLRCGHRSMRGSAPISTQDQPGTPHCGHLNCLRSNLRGGGGTSKWPSA